MNFFDIMKEYFDIFVDGLEALKTYIYNQLLSIFDFDD